MTSSDELDFYKLGRKDALAECQTEIDRLRRRESELLHWLRQAQLKAEFAKEKAKLARDNADYAIQYAIDAEACAIRALSQHNHADSK